MSAEPIRLHAPHTNDSPGQIAGAGGLPGAVPPDATSTAKPRGQRRPQATSPTDQDAGDRPGAAPAAAGAKRKKSLLPPELAAVRLIGIAELCELVGIGRSTAERWLAAGRLPEPIRLSRTCHRWRLAEAIEWIAAGCPDPRKNRRH
jgi:predicted DNA-binding transcriptional regulator AlpA